MDIILYEIYLKYISMNTLMIYEIYIIAKYVPYFFLTYEIEQRQ